MSLRLVLALLACGTAAAAAARLGRPPPTTCLTSQSGAVPSTSQYQTAALQAAIDSCSDRCGTVVVDLPGAYLTAALRLTDCVHLELPAGVTLLAGDKREDYPGPQSEWFLLQFNKCDKCSLSGNGTIDGRARRWLAAAPSDGHSGRQIQAVEEQPASLSVLQEQQQGQEAVLQASGDDPPRKKVHNWQDASCPNPDECRPRLLGVLDSGDIKVSGITLTDPVYWALHVWRGVRVVIDGVTIRGDRGIPNTDGIDVDGSRYVTIRNVDIDTADDAIAVKTTGKWPTSHVAVSNSKLRSRSAGVKVGSETRADISFLTFSGLTVEANRGLALQLRDAGDVSHVVFSNIMVSTKFTDSSWWGAAEPIYVTALPRSATTKVGKARDIAFRDITGTAENGLFIQGGPLGGGPGHLLHTPYSLYGLVLQRIRITQEKRSNYAGGCQDYRPSSNGTSPHNSAAAMPNAEAGWWPAGLDCASGTTAPIWLSGAERVELTDVYVERKEPWRHDWRRGAWVDSYNLRAVKQTRVTVV
ncbi:pectin lyase [Chlorella sorokiniana]|uniref:Pectin lyase n=1 Tax=Chlorella sorokiniana TaxID=3076 RepID=A0A2P6TKM3_CHLSO|nr:pectin lyase [Chlorella sorokiniana]|eukprot:PRW44625.1 pectin lyase [Chlorella sorokiniana]